MFGRFDLDAERRRTTFRRLDLLVGGNDADVLVGGADLPAVVGQVDVGLPERGFRRDVGENVVRRVLVAEHYVARLREVRPARGVVGLSGGSDGSGSDKRRSEHHEA